MPMRVRAHLNTLTAHSSFWFRSCECENLNRPTNDTDTLPEYQKISKFWHLVKSENLQFGNFVLVTILFDRQTV